MTDGRIGLVDLGPQDNIFDMSGGTIDRNLLVGVDNDTITLSGGTIGGSIVDSDGADKVTEAGGSVRGNVSLGPGNDTFTWNGGGTISGVLDLSADNDTASVRNLTDAQIGTTTRISGGLGTDNLTLGDVQTGGVPRFDSWESIHLTNGTQLTFSSTLALDDSGTGTGSLSVDATSTLYGGNTNGRISAFTAGQLVTVINSGRIDLTNGGDSTSDTFTIGGNYPGNNGLLFLSTVLGDDSSATAVICRRAGPAFSVGKPT